MAKLLKLRRGTTTQHGSFTGAEGEVTIDTTKDTAVVHDGAQAGGRPLAREDMSNVSSASIAGQLGTDSIAVTKISAGTLPSDVKIVDANVSGNLTIESADIVNGTIVDEDVSGTAAIAGSKIHPNFGSQNIATTGTLASNDISITGGQPALSFIDDGTDPDYRLYNNNGVLKFYDITNGADRLVVNTDGHIDVKGNLDCEGGLDVTGNMTVTGTVDGRDVAADGTKLDGIESSATADQTSAEINSALTGENITPLRVYSTGGTLGRDSNDYIYFSDNAHMDVVINGSAEFKFEADGDFHADGDIVAFSSTVASDINLKENIEIIPNALDKVHALNGVSFDWKKTGEKSAGVIAQEVQKVLPEAVKQVTPLKGGDSHLTVNYHALTSILIESIKELKAEIEELKGGK